MNRDAQSQRISALVAVAALATAIAAGAANSPRNPATRCRAGSTIPTTIPTLMLPAVPERRAGLSRAAGRAERGADRRRHAAAVRRRSRCRTRSRWRCSRTPTSPSRPRTSASRATTSFRSKARTTSRCTCSRRRTFPSIRRQNFLDSRPGRIGNVHAGLDLDDRARKHHSASVGVAVRH